MEAHEIGRGKHYELIEALGIFNQGEFDNIVYSNLNDNVKGYRLLSETIKVHEEKIMHISYETEREFSITLGHKKITVLYDIMLKDLSSDKIERMTYINFLSERLDCSPQALFDATNIFFNTGRIENPNNTEENLDLFLLHGKDKKVMYDYVIAKVMHQEAEKLNNHSIALASRTIKRKFGM